MVKHKFLLFPLLLTLLAVFVTGCGDKTTDPPTGGGDTNSTGAIEGIISLPASLTGDSSASAPTIRMAATPTTISNNEQTIQDVFTMFRDYVAFVDDVAQGIEGFIQEIPTNIDNYEGPYAQNGVNWYIVFTNNAQLSTDYTHRVEFYKGTNKEDLTFLFEIDNVGRNKGIAKATSNYSDAFPCNILVEFDASGEEDVMTVKIEGVLDNVTNPDPWQLDNIIVDVRRTNGMLYLSANSYHPLAGSNTAADADVFTNGEQVCYIITAVVDETADKAVVNLALPEVTETLGSTPFTTFSLAQKYTEKVVAYWRTVPETNTSLYDVATLLGLTNKPATNAELTVAQFTDIVTAMYTHEGITNEDVNSMYFVSQLNNPVYLTLDGLVTNGTTATVTGFPSASELDAITAISITDVTNVSITLE